MTKEMSPLRWAPVDMEQRVSSFDGMAPLFIGEGPGLRKKAVALNFWFFCFKTKEQGLSTALEVTSGIIQNSSFKINQDCCAPVET